MKKMLYLTAICLSMLLCLFPVFPISVSALEEDGTEAGSSVYSGEPDTSWFSEAFEGYDASTQTFTLTTADQFAGLALICAENSLSGYTIRLANDLVFNTDSVSGMDAPVYTWTPISNFAGTLNGDGHLISGLYYNGTGTTIGLFSTLNGTVKNLGIVNSSFTTTGNQCGSIAGQVIAAAVIENVYSEADIHAANQAGGIVGLGGCTLSDCVFAGTVTAKTNYAGGIIGEDAGKKAVFTDCINLGAICAQGNRAAGMAGQLRTTGESLTRCLNAGEINGSISGAFVGRLATELAVNACVFIQEYGTTLEGDLVGGSYPDATTYVYGLQQIKCQTIFEEYGWIAVKNGCPMPSQTVAQLAVKADIFHNGTTMSDELEMQTLWGASARLSSPTGLRFETQISKSAYDTLTEKYGVERIRFGTLIAPAAFVLEAGDFTKEALDALEKSSAVYLDVESDDFFRSTDTHYIFSGSVVNIFDENKELEFMAIGYIEIDGTIYYSRTVTQRCVSEVAIAALKDTRTEAVGEYIYPMTVGGTLVYSYLPEEQREILNSFAVWGDDEYDSQIGN